MIRMILLISCFLFVQKDESILTWNTSYKLSWSDFKAKPHGETDAVALTASGITFEFSIRQTDDNRILSFKTDVSAHFYTENSWYKPELADHHVLGHEQLHFDITELHARKFRQSISQLKTNQNIKRELQQLNKNNNKALTAMQNAYDEQTDYSRTKETQAKWKLYITQELEKLSEFKQVD